MERLNLNTDELKGRLQDLVGKVETLAENKATITEVEQTLLSSLLRMGKELTEHYVQLRAHAIQAEGSPKDSSGKKMKHKGRETRPFLSVFGEIGIERVRYCSAPVGNYYPLDKALCLPDKKYSWLLQDWLGGSACDVSYEQSCELLNNIFGFKLTGMVSQRIIQDMGEKVDCFYESEPAISPETEGSVLGLGADGKGVRVQKSERSGPPSEAVEQEAARKMKGEKRGTKKEATVCLTFSFDPVPRNPEEVIKDLHLERSPEEKAEYKAKLKAEGGRPREAKNTRKRAYMAAQKKALASGIEQLKERDPEAKKEIVALIDGGPGLENGIREQAEKAGICILAICFILDIIHVSEYIWKAANAVLGEKSPKRQAWVRNILLKVLQSKVAEVITEMEGKKEKAGLKKNQKEALGKVIAYFRNHSHKMDYKAYLEKGYPISTGIVEGCCGHIVKDRMEGSGMRWTTTGAQNMLNCRAVKKNGDWKKFMNFIHNSNKNAPVGLMA